MSKYENLAKLKELFNSGILNQEEFELEKKKLLETEESVINSTNSGMSLSEEIKQNYNDPKQKDLVNKIGLILVIGFFFIIVFFVMLFGWHGATYALKNLWGF